LTLIEIENFFILFSLARGAACPIYLTEILCCPMHAR